MSVEFTWQDFFSPINILKLKYLFGKSQYYTPDEMAHYQQERLKSVLSHALLNVPYYSQFRSQLDPYRFELKNLSQIPKIKKKMVQERGTDFQSKEMTKLHARRYSTSGSSGAPFQFFLDRYTNALEFVYYWRHWNWAGYRLGQPFSEFSTQFFQKRQNLRDLIVYRQKATARLLLNSTQLSRTNAALFYDAILNHNSRFLKGLPSVLYYFCLFLQDMGKPTLPLKGVFCTGETLFPFQRNLIEKTFMCKAYNSYGHMERVVAICECPNGGLHVNSDYGLMEFERIAGDVPTSQPQGPYRAKIIGSTLYNLSMPLIRYDVGDIVELDSSLSACSCGRTLPLVKSIEGRQEDVVVTPDGKIIPTLFLVFDDIPGILCGHIIQEDINHLVLKVVSTTQFTLDAQNLLLSNVKQQVGENIKVEIVRAENIEDLIRPGIKQRVVTSKIRHLYPNL